MSKFIRKTVFREELNMIKLTLHEPGIDYSIESVEKSSTWIVSQYHLLTIGKYFIHLLEILRQMVSNRHTETI